jgi:hypothetical protein
MSRCSRRVSILTLGEKPQLRWRHRVGIVDRLTGELRQATNLRRGDGRL